MPNGLTARRDIFAKRDVMIALAEAQGQGAGAAQLSAIADRLLRSAEVVRLGLGLDRRCTTRELLAAEERIVRHAEGGRGRGVAVIAEAELARALERLPCQLSTEQRQAVLAIARSGNRIDVLEALAGTGRTTCAAALREAYERAGYQVLGAAPTARAVRELKERAGISSSRTLDAWALKLTTNAQVLAYPRSPAVLVVDEAGMAHTRVSAVVIDHAPTAGVKVIAIGDSGQLSSVQAGGWLGAISQRVGANELREVMRQRDPRERRALADVHRGEPVAYLELKRRRGELRVFEGEQAGLEAEEALIERWLAVRDPYGDEQAIMICRDNARRDRLNDLARARLRERGQLGESVQIGEQRWGAGERVIARRNDHGRDVDNGMRGTLESVDAREGTGADGSQDAHAPAGNPETSGRPGPDPDEPGAGRAEAQAAADARPAATASGDGRANPRPHAHDVVEREAGSRSLAGGASVVARSQRTIVSLLAYGGLRPVEDRGSRWGDLHGRTLHVVASKTGRPRDVELLAPLAQDLAEWRLLCGRPSVESLIVPTTDGDDVAEQAGHSVATLARHYAGVIRELEDQPRVPAAEAIREARDRVAGSAGQHAQRSAT